MKSYKADELNQQLVYKLLSGSVVPRPIAWLTTQSQDGLVNVAPFSFFNVASSHPPLLSVAFTGNKDSLNNLLSTQEAVVHLVNSDNVELMNLTASRLPAHISEAEEFLIELTPSQMVKVPTIKNSSARFETKLYQHIPLEDEGHLILLEVIHFAFDDEILDEQNFHINTDKLAPIARLAGNDYAVLGETFTIKRPE
ncbi:flavin reductase family protein [Lactococcus protaetiae]|uniref:Flavin reductase family protein n=1 Tax=Lactococcus protaetiae TaxID=2592653 RepID=A0A514Z6T2_9LACT|nr:flavin reductase family protein [Lactococcus protaetiae]QDK70301.1 flavin reductase family protein [Lactococcus protaetiae]